MNVSVSIRLRTYLAVNQPYAFFFVVDEKEDCCCQKELIKEA